MRLRTSNGVPPLLWAGGIAVLTPLVLLAGIGALMTTVAVAVRDTIVADRSRGAATPVRGATAGFRVAAVPAAAPQSAIVLAFPTVPARLDSAARARELSLTHAA